MRRGVLASIYCLLLTLGSGCAYAPQHTAQMQAPSVQPRQHTPTDIEATSIDTALSPLDNNKPADSPALIQNNTPIAQISDYSEFVKTQLLRIPKNLDNPAGIDTSIEISSPTLSATQLPTTPPSPVDVWQRIVHGYQIKDYDHKKVDPYIRWYMKKQDYLDRLSERARPYLYYITEALEARGMPTEIALLPIIESAFQPFAYSPGRAAGIWQFIPSTGKHYGLKQNWWYDGRRDVYQSTQAALDYLEKLHKQFDGDWLLALASYNTGENNVARAIRRNKHLGKPTDFWSLSLPRETRGYVPKLLAISKVLANAEYYGVRFNPIPNKPYWGKAHIDSQLDLAKAGKYAGISVEEIYRLNPGLNRWATPPGDFDLMLPEDRVEAFKINFANSTPEQRVSWKRHTIKRGETLSYIAKRYHTSVRMLKEFNRMHSSRIRAGKAIIVPVAAQEMPQYALSEGQRKLQLLNRYPPTRKSKIIHTVKRGDTYWDIARHYHTSVKLLTSWNKLSPKDTLHIGQKLVIWTKTPKQTTSSALASANINPIRKIIYTVRRGDSLSKISKNFKIKVTQLKKWNNLGKYIHPGQKLTLYIDITRQIEG